MQRNKILKRIGACVLACASFTLAACDTVLSSSGSILVPDGSVDMDELTLETVSELLASYGVLKKGEKIESLFDEENGEGYEYLIVEEKGAVLVKDGEKLYFGQTGDCEHTKFGVPKAQQETDCENIGIETSVCKNCSAIKYEFEMPFGHDWELVDEVPATKTERGKKIYECKECRKSKTERTPKLENENSGSDDTGDDTGDGGVTIDPSKTVLRVAAQDMGDGRFLDALEDYFEEFYKDYCFEAGKIGVDIIIDYRNDLYNLSTLPYMDSEVLFVPSTLSTEQIANNGWVADITDIMCEDRKDTGFYLEEKIDGGYLSEVSVNQKYYAIPYIRDSWGLIYNAELFNRYQFEVPNTTDELLALCDEMRYYGVTPLITTGAYPMYLDELTKIWWAQYEGVENYTNFWNGVNADGRYSSDIFAQQGRLTSWEILQKIYDNNFLHRDSMNMAVSHMDAQTRFLISGYQREPIAMITEGSWMLTEAEVILREIEQNYGNADLDIRMMKTPVNSAIINKCSSIPDDETLSAVITAIDEGYSYYEGVTDYDFALVREARNIVSTTGYNAIMNANIAPNKEALAKEFLRFVTSQEGIETLAATTGATTAIGWEITEEAYLRMDSVRRSAFEILRESIALPDESKLTMLEFGVPVDGLYCNGMRYQYIIQAFRQGYTASDIFHSTIAWFDGRFEDMLINYGVPNA